MRRIALFSLLTALAAGCSSSSELSYGTPPAQRGSIAYLKSICTDDPVVIAEDLNICGVVTGNDLYGEFNKTLILQDESGGIEISADHTLLADDYPLEAVVSVSCNGLAVGRFGGKVRLGAAPTGDYSIDRIPRSELGRHLRCETQTSATPEAERVRFSDVGARHIDCFVRFDGVEFIDNKAWCDTDPETGKPVTTERMIRNANGETFRIRTEAGCMYATKPLPQGTGSILGIIDYFNGVYSLRVTNSSYLFATSATHPTAYPSAARR